MEQVFQMAVKVAADSVEQLRPLDVDRVFDEVENMGGDAKEFGEWLLSKELSPRTRQVITEIMEEI